MLYIIVSVALLLNIILHELAHYATARFFNYAVNTVEVGLGPKLASFRWRETDFIMCLFPIGGRLVYQRETFGGSSSKEGAIAASGPLANLLFGAAFYALATYVERLSHDPLNTYMAVACLLAAIAATGVGVYNLMPIPPLDGGVLALLIVNCVLRLRQSTTTLVTRLGACVLSVTTLCGLAGFLFRVAYGG